MLLAKLLPLVAATMFQILRCCGPDCRAIYRLSAWRITNDTLPTFCAGHRYVHCYRVKPEGISTRFWYRAQNGF